MEYKPRVRRGRVKLPFGWYVSPVDERILIPNQEEIEALHYAFRMKAKHNTPYRECTMWLHQATGKKMTPAGFMYAYKHWIKKLRSARTKEVQARMKLEYLELQKQVDENYSQLRVSIEDHDDITAVAKNFAQKEWKKKEATR